MYAERGLVGAPATVWLCGETLTIEHQDEPLSQFSVVFEPDKRHLARVGHPRLFETRFVSPQPFLWYLYWAKTCCTATRPSTCQPQELLNAACVCPADRREAHVL